MDGTLLSKLTASELEQYQRELSDACENHARWLSRLNRTLICRCKPEKGDLATNPHRSCRFGRWYHGIDNPALLENPNFTRIGDVHKEMHTVAGSLLRQAMAQQPIATKEYDRLSELTLQLRDVAEQLRNDMQGNRALNAKVLGAIFENAREGVIITDTRGEIISVNHAFEKVTGYSKNEIIGKSTNVG